MHNKNNNLIDNRNNRKQSTNIDNKLINNNFHISNTYQTSLNNRTLSKQKSSNDNFIKNILGQQNISQEKKNTSELQSALDNQKKLYEQSNTIKPKNLPYKIIMKDKLPNKLIDNVDINVKNPHLLEVHRVNKEIEADIIEFQKKLLKLQISKKEHDMELELEFNDSNFQKNKQKYDFSQSFIDNISLESNVSSDMKSDYIDYYEKQKIEADRKKKYYTDLLSRVKNVPLINDNEVF